MLSREVQTTKSALDDSIKKLKKSEDEKKEMLEKFLNSEQIKLLEKGRIGNWSSKSIVKGLKFRFALSVHGYEFLRKYRLSFARIQYFKP